MTALSVPTASRLQFEPFTEADAPFIVGLLNEPGFLRFIGDRGIRTEADAVGYLRHGPIAMYARHGFGLLRLTLRESGEAVGMCGLLQREGLDRPDLGFALLGAFEGRGLATEAGRAVVDHATAALGLPSLLAIVNPDNAASIRILTRLGFERPERRRLPGMSQDVLVLTRG